jgi:hypothetical protein
MTTKEQRHGNGKGNGKGKSNGGSRSLRDCKWMVAGELAWIEMTAAWRWMPKQEQGDR